MDSTVNDLSVPIDQVLRSSIQCLRNSILDSTESIKGDKNSAETLSTFKSNRQEEDAAIVSNRM